MPDVTALMTTFFFNYTFWNEQWDESDTEFSTCAEYKCASYTHFLGGLQINVLVWCAHQKVWKHDVTFIFT